MRTSELGSAFTCSLPQDCPRPSNSTTNAILTPTRVMPMSPSMSGSYRVCEKDSEQRRPRAFEPRHEAVHVDRRAAVREDRVELEDAVEFVQRKPGPASTCFYAERKFNLIGSL
jgi:hypothetical protein